MSHSRSEFCSNQESQIALEELSHKCVQRCIEKWAPGLRHRLESNHEHIDENLSLKHVIWIRFKQFWIVLFSNILQQQ